MARNTYEVTSEFDRVGFITPVINNLSPTDTVIPTIVAMAPITTDWGFCAGFDVAYDTTDRYRFWDPEDGARLNYGERLDFQQILLDYSTDDIAHIRGVYASPDQQDDKTLAVLI